ncbi:MAG: hypothetical protein AAFY25_12965 [Pseudomonadota bacterium]
MRWVEGDNDAIAGLNTRDPVSDLFNDARAIRQRDKLIRDRHWRHSQGDHEISGVKRIGLNGHTRLSWAQGG